MKRGTIILFVFILFILGCTTRRDISPAVGDVSNHSEINPDIFIIHFQKYEKVGFDQNAFLRRTLQGFISDFIDQGLSRKDVKNKQKPYHHTYCIIDDGCLSPEACINDLCKPLICGRGQIGINHTCVNN